MTEQVGYLLHIGAPLSGGSVSPELSSILGSLSDDFGVNISIVHFDDTSTFHSSPRFIFHLPDYLRDDALANHVAESIIYSAKVLTPPLGEPAEPSAILMLPKEMVDNIQKVNLRDLLELEENRLPSERFVEYPGLAIGPASHHTEFRVAVALRASRVIFHSSDLMKAAIYLSLSHDEFHVFPGQISEVINNPDAEPTTGWEVLQVKTALINAFKAVEAILGEPPSDRGKISRKLEGLGIDPSEEFGYPVKEPLLDFIYRFQEARDKYSVHGGTPYGRIKIKDMLLFQDCADYLFVKAIEHYLGEELY